MNEYLDASLTQRGASIATRSTIVDTPNTIIDNILLENTRGVLIGLDGVKEYNPLEPNARVPEYTVRKDLPPQMEINNRLISNLQQWEGCVTEIGNHGFRAELHDLTVRDRPPEFADFDFQDVVKSDLPLIAVGSVFYLNVGTETKTWGQITKILEIRFKRSPKWTLHKISKNMKQGEDLHSRLFSYAVEQQ